MLISSNTTKAPALGLTPPGKSREGTFRAGRRNRAPTHPGAIVKSALDALGGHVSDHALAIGMTKAALGNLVNQRAAVTPNSALRLAKYLGTGAGGAEHLLGMQMDFDLWHARKDLAGDLAGIRAAKRPRPTR